jgi:SAM-dependent methyltransferase
MAAFKADIINEFVREHGIESVIEFGCGDGNQLRLAHYPQYTGYDISPDAVAACLRLFKDDASKSFQLAAEYDGRKADLAMSLDVIFHLTEDNIYNAYMHRLFAASSKHVLVYSSNQNEPIEPVSPHVRHRLFTRWIEREASPEWKLVKRIPNAFPYNGDYKSTSFSDFFFFEKE